MEKIRHTGLAISNALKEKTQNCPIIGKFSGRQVSQIKAEGQRQKIVTKLKAQIQEAKTLHDLNKIEKKLGKEKLLKPKELRNLTQGDEIASTYIDKHRKDLNEEITKKREEIENHHPLYKELKKIYSISPQTAEEIGKSIDEKIGRLREQQNEINRQFDIKVSKVKALTHLNETGSIMNKAIAEAKDTNELSTIKDIIENTYGKIRSYDNNPIDNAYRDLTLKLAEKEKELSGQG